MCIKRSCSVRRAQSFPEFELSRMNDYHTVASKGQRLALAHFLIGIALIATGVVDRLMQETWVGYSGFGILVGIWVRWNIEIFCIHFVLRSSREYLSGFDKTTTFSKSPKELAPESLFEEFSNLSLDLIVSYTSL